MNTATETAATFDELADAQAARWFRDAEKVAGEPVAHGVVHEWPGCHGAEVQTKWVFTAYFRTELAALRYHYAHRSHDNIRVIKPNRNSAHWQVTNWVDPFASN